MAWHGMVSQILTAQHELYLAFSPQLLLHAFALVNAILVLVSIMLPSGGLYLQGFFICVTYKL